MNKYYNLISYFGGKYPHLKWLIDKFPAGNYHFIDLMCGSANVALNVNYPLITINDLNSDVINLFEVLRDSHDDFTRAIYFTPFSREELYKIIKAKDDECTKIERARRYFVRSQMGYGANGSQNNHYGMGFEYKLHASNYYRVDNWNLKLKKLAFIADKLKSFQIENRNALELFDSVDKPTSIIYIDPPYLFHTRSSKKRYRHEVGIDFHEQISEKAKHAQSKIIISGYSSPIYDDLFKDFVKTQNKETSATVHKRKTRECIWTNYDPQQINGVYQLWD